MITSADPCHPPKVASLQDRRPWASLPSPPCLHARDCLGRNGRALHAPDAEASQRRSRRRCQQVAERPAASHSNPQGWDLPNPVVMYMLRSLARGCAIEGRL